MCCRKSLKEYHFLLFQTLFTVIHWNAALMVPYYTNLLVVTSICGTACSRIIKQCFIEKKLLDRLGILLYTQLGQIMD